MRSVSEYNVPGAIAAILCGFLVLMPAADRLLAQGSTGGTVGLKEKSVSGTEGPSLELPKSHRKIAPAESATVITSNPCSAGIGKWAWFNGGDVEINAGGTLGRNGAPGQGTWACNGGTLILQWTEGWTDTLVVRSNGARLSGTNQYGVSVSGIRE